MRKVIVRRSDHAHGGDIMVFNLGRGTVRIVPQGRPVRLPDHLIRSLRSERVWIYSRRGRGWSRSLRHVYSVRAAG